MPRTPKARGARARGTSRLIADPNLAACVAYEGRPEWLVEIVYRGVRLGRWNSLHYGGRDGRVTDEAMPE